VQCNTALKTDEDLTGATELYGCSSKDTGGLELLALPGFFDCFKPGKVTWQR